MKRTILLGATKYDELAFGEFELRRQRNKPNQFSASFITVRPFNSSLLGKEVYADCLIDGLDKTQLFDMCEYYNCSPSELTDKIAEEYEVKDLVDCSLYENEFELEDGLWLFESCGCGQHDLRNEMTTYVSKIIFDKLNYLWDEYHLNEMPDEEFDTFMKLVKKCYKNFDEENWIKNYIEEHRKDL